MEEGTIEADILIVDDTVANLQLLSSMLKERGFKVRPVTSGRMALRAARAQPPDLILLDVNMPEMNGLEVCRQFKADPRLTEIPVIFISALTEVENKIEGFAVGGVDYVTKPFQWEEIEARITSHLKIRRLQAQLESRNRHLSDQNLELERLRELSDNLTCLIVHDLRSPLAGIQGYLELLQINTAERLREEDREDIEQSLRSCSRINEMINSLLDITRLEQARMPIEATSSDLVEIAKGCLSELESLKGGRELRLNLSPEPVLALCDPNLTRRIISNLLHNAFSHTEISGRIDLGLTIADQVARVTVGDDGPGIAAEFHAKVFTTFGQAEMRQRRQPRSTGLGLAFCKLAVAAQGGEIGLESEPGKGSTFWFTVPLVSQANDDRAE